MEHNTTEERERQEILNMFNSLTLEQLKKIIDDLELFSLMKIELWENFKENFKRNSNAVKGKDNTTQQKGNVLLGEVR